MRWISMDVYETKMKMCEKGLKDWRIATGRRRKLFEIWKDS